VERTGESQNSVGGAPGRVVVDKTTQSVSFNCATPFIEENLAKYTTKIGFMYTRMFRPFLQPGPRLTV
jgi:hypothetical protein